MRAIARFISQTETRQITRSLGLSRLCNKLIDTRLGVEAR